MFTHIIPSVFTNHYHNISRYADDIISVSEFHVGSLNFNVLDGFLCEKGFTVNLGKIEDMIFHTSLLLHKQIVFTVSGRHVEVVDPTYI